MGKRRDGFTLLFYQECTRCPRDDAHIVRTTSTVLVGEQERYSASEEMPGSRESRPGEGNTVTEQEWMQYADPRPMLLFLEGKPSGRKLRLFACAWCRSVWKLLSRDRQERLEAIERFADDNGQDTILV